MFADVILLLILVSVSFGFYQIVKQQGRIILRLEALEERKSGLPAPERPGLEIGTAFPPFIFRDLEGSPVSLNDFRGKRVLLIHWSPQCGFCDLIAHDLARLQPEFEKRSIQLLLLAHGDEEANRKLIEEHGFKCPTLLYKNGEVPEPLANLGTPSAYFLDQEGRIAKALAVGSDEVPALAEQIVKEDVEESTANTGERNKRLPGEKPLSASSILRNGLKPGTPAPGFRLPDIYGSEVSLDSYRGRRVLLVFSDPHCGPCEQLAPQLTGFDRQHGDENLALILIGRGEVEENRKKAEEHGTKFPIVIQDKWRLSKQYGIFSTPVAFLIDEDGVIANDVAIGPDAIMELAQKGLKTQKESSYELSYR